MTLRRRLGAVCLTALGLALATAPARAEPRDAVAEGSAGSLTIGSTTVAPIAACTTGGTLEATAEETAVPDVVTYSGSRSVCTLDESRKLASVTVSGGRFGFDALRQYGGPHLGLSSYTATCDTTATGSTASFQFSGLTGASVPAQVPANYVVTIPGGPDGKPMATVTFNEAIVPSPPDGSMTMHLVHIRLFPQGGPTSGDAFVGTLYCAPAR